MSRLETRDQEMLRTLARLHFVTSAQLNATFFSSEKVGYRRIKALAERDLIRRHTKGAQPRTSYCAWRLTALGIGAVRDKFISEPVSEALDERLADLSLVDLEHREAISRVYLELVGGDSRDRVEESSWQAVQQRAAAVRQRADQFRWHADGAVVLRFRDLGQDHRVVPDATIESVKQPVRIFLELDRSNKSITRIEENLERYATFVRGPYRSQFADDKVPCVVYLARSQQRCHNIAKSARARLHAACRWKVTTHDEAATWLAEILLAEHRGPRTSASSNAILAEAAVGTSDPGLRVAAHDLLRSTSDLLKRSTSAFDALGLEQPELIARWKRDLRALYELVREGSHGG